MSEQQATDQQVETGETAGTGLPEGARPHDADGAASPEHHAPAAPVTAHADSAGAAVEPGARDEAAASGSVVAPAVEPAAAPVPGPVTETVTESVAESAAGPVAEPVAEQASGPDAAPVADSAAEPVADPVAEPGTDSSTAPADEPASEEVARPATEAVPGSAGTPVPEAPAAVAPPAPTPPPTPAAPQAPVPPRPAPPRPAPPRPGPPAVPAPPPAATRPAAAPAAATPVAQPSPVAAASAHPERWGRVDAEGTIYVRTADGERVVGSWQAGAPTEGLAHFARRFDDILTEVELLAARLTAGGGDPKQTMSSAKTIRDGLDEATVVGDLAGLRARIDDVIGQAEEAVGAARSARDAQRAAAVARKEELAVEAETLADEATQWKQAGDRFKEILDEWRTIRGIDRKTDELLWKRFSKSREAFNRRRGSHFADLDRQRASARTRKEDLVVEAEKLAGSDDWGPTAARFRDLMTEWKASGRAHKDADDTLWQRFRGAQDAFFARRSETFAERDAEFATNAEAKKALLVEAERIDVSDPGNARAALRGIQERWEEIGKVPRDDIRTLEARLRAVEEKVREASDRQWRRTDPEAEARVEQFRERVAQFEAQAEKARAAGDARRAKEADAQAAQWREWLTTAEQAVQQR